MRFLKSSDFPILSSEAVQNSTPAPGGSLFFWGELSSVTGARLACLIAHQEGVAEASDRLGGLNKVLSLNAGLVQAIVECIACYIVEFTGIFPGPDQQSKSPM